MDACNQQANAGKFMFIAGFSDVPQLFFCVFLVNCFYRFFVSVAESRKNDDFVVTFVCFVAGTAHDRQLTHTHTGRQGERETHRNEIELNFTMRIEI